MLKCHLAIESGPQAQLENHGYSSSSIEIIEVSLVRNTFIMSFTTIIFLDILSVSLRVRSGNLISFRTVEVCGTESLEQGKPVGSF